MLEGLEHLPKFTVSRVEPTGVTGAFKSPLLLGDGWDGYLAPEQWQCLYGKFFSFVLSTRQAIFKPDEKGPSGPVAKKTYRYIDGYWGERVELVLDKGSR